MDTGDKVCVTRRLSYLHSILHLLPVKYWVVVTTYAIERDRRGHDRMVVGFATTYAIIVYHHYVVSSNPAHGEVYNIMW
jgi:hypothetical protein